MKQNGLKNRARVIMARIYEFSRKNEISFNFSQEKEKYFHNLTYKLA